MGLDASILPVVYDPELEFRSHWDFNERILTAANRLYGPLHADVGIPFMPSLIDLVDAELAAEGVAVADEVPEDFGASGPRADQDPRPIYRLILQQVRQRCDEGETFVYAFSC